MVEVAAGGNWKNYRDFVATTETAVPVETTENGAADVERAENPTPLEEATQWFASEQNRLQSEIDSCYRLLETDRSRQTELLGRVVQLAAEKRAMQRADCPLLTQKGKEIVEAQDAVEQLLEQYAAAAVQAESHQADEAESGHYQRERDRLVREINWHLDQLAILGHDLKRES